MLPKSHWIICLLLACLAVSSVFGEEDPDCQPCHGDCHLPCPPSTISPTDVPASTVQLPAASESPGQTTPAPSSDLETSAPKTLTDETPTETAARDVPAAPSTAGPSATEPTNEDDATTNLPVVHVDETTVQPDIQSTVPPQSETTAGAGLPVIIVTGAAPEQTTPKDEPVTTGFQPTTETQVTLEVDPCSSATTDHGVPFREARPADYNECFEHIDTSSGWLKFEIDGNAAEIPNVAVKQDACGVHFSYHVSSESPVPASNKTVEAEVCTPMQGEAIDHCAHSRPVNIKNCNDEYFVYNFPGTLKLDELCDAGSAGLCLREPGEEIPYEYLSNQPATTTTPGAESTEMPPDLLPRIRNLTEEQANGAMTIEYKQPKDMDTKNVSGSFLSKDRTFRTFIATTINTHLCRPPPEVPPVETTGAPPTTDTPTTTRAPTTQPPPTTIIITTEPQSTADPTTVTTTPPPTEPIDIYEVVTKFEDEEDAIDPVTEKDMGGVQIPSNTDDDIGPGPGSIARRKRNNRSDTKPDSGSEGTEEPLKEVTAAEEEEDETCGGFDKDDVYYVYDTPKVSNGILQISFVVVKQDEGARSKRSTGGTVVPQDVLGAAFDDLDKEDHKKEVDMEYVQHYQGEPKDVGPPPTPSPKQSVWETHTGLFIAVIVLVAICIIVIIIGILCIKCKGRRSRSTPEKTPLRSEEGHVPTVIENPISDEEMVKGETCYMTEAPNTAYTPNGSGQQFTKSHDSWVVPLDQLSSDERGRPEVENTKL